MATVNKKGDRLATIGARLLEERKRLKLSQPAFAALAGQGKHSQIRYEADERLPDGNYFAAIANAGADIHYIITGKRLGGFEGVLPTTQISPVDPNQPIAADFDLNGARYISIPRMQIDVSAGSGLSVIDNSNEEPLIFSSAWLTRNGINSGLCGVVRVRGDSMAPTVPDHALVLVHAGERTVERPGIYAFSEGDEAFIKRLTPLGADIRAGVAVTSDNPSYPPRVITGPGLADLNVAGRVRAALIDLA